VIIGHNIEAGTVKDVSIELAIPGLYDNLEIYDDKMQVLKTYRDAAGSLLIVNVSGRDIRQFFIVSVYE